MSTAKKAVMSIVKQLPDDGSLEDAQYQLYVRQKVERSLAAAAQGKVETQAQVKKRLSKWLAP